jgi:predicted dehydrogenase
MNTTRWGLIGAGWIANKAIAPAMHAQPNAIVQAVASGDPKRSKLLNPITIHDSYEALINDPLVDAVYISLPNHLHCEWSIKALNAGKHVLCEKPFAMNVSEVESMVYAARDNNRLLVEAVSAMWHPRMKRLVDYVKAGNIGEVVSIDSSFTFPASIEGNYRLSPAMGGGALFDVGIYPLHAITALIGDDASTVIKSCDVKVGPTGIDLTSRWTMRINDLITASGLASFEMPENQSLIVRGEKSSAELIGTQAFTSWHSASSLRIGQQVEEFEAVDAYMLMIENFGKRIHGEESWVLPLETSLTVQKMLGQLQSSH